MPRYFSAPYAAMMPLDWFTLPLPLLMLSHSAMLDYAAALRRLPLRCRYDAAERHAMIARCCYAYACYAYATCRYATDSAVIAAAAAIRFDKIMPMLPCHDARAMLRHIAATLIRLLRCLIS